jgi:hypothetical protein
VTVVYFMVIPASFVSGHDRVRAEESSSEEKRREYQYNWATGRILGVTHQALLVILFSRSARCVDVAQLHRA